MSQFNGFNLSALEILVKTKDIRATKKGNYEPVTGVAKFFNKQYSSTVQFADCYIACGKWNKLPNPTGDTINIVPYLKHLLPSKGRGVGLFTFQNGIQNTTADFVAMGNSIIKNLTREQPLCIGLYNKSQGLFSDLNRLRDEQNLNRTSILSLYQLLESFGQILMNINPNLLWTHVAHSEGGLIANKVIEKEINLSPKIRHYIRHHLITATYGGVASIPDHAVLKAFNTYSRDDITMFVAKANLDKMPKPPISPEQYAELKEGAKQAAARGLFGKKTGEEVYKEIITSIEAG